MARIERAPKVVPDFYGLDPQHASRLRTLANDADPDVIYDRYYDDDNYEVNRKTTEILNDLRLALISALNDAEQIHVYGDDK